MLRYIGGNNCKKAIDIGYKYLKKNKKPIINFAIEETNQSNNIYKEYTNLIQEIPNNNFSIALKLSSINFDLKIARDIADLCLEKETKLFIDAEDNDNNSKYQEMVNQLVFDYNTNSNLIYKTYQMYRIDSLETLNNDMKLFIKYNKYFSCKLVRGAYWNSEYEGGNLFTKKIDTDNSYNQAILNIYNSQYTDKTKIVLATHNKFSAELGVLLNKDVNIFEFAHLQGMRENYYNKLNIINNIDSVHVYIPYGPYTKMIPYLVRRLYENVDMIKHLY